MLPLLLFSCLAPSEQTPVEISQPTQPFRGFNLLGKFDINWSNQGYLEKDFELMSRWGFNFVRLPLDYRTYTERGNWYDFQENQLQQIDQVLQWGNQYGVHLQINLHRAPGYCVNPATQGLPENQRLDLWTDKKAQDAFIAHWKMFARRYKDYDNQQVSFNLVNEPHGVNSREYADLVIRTVEAIRSIDPDRLIYADGLEYGREVVQELVDYPVGQAFHQYQPFTLTHYKASWVDGSYNWAEPVWPQQPLSPYLYGPSKSESHSALVLEGTFPRGTEIGIHVTQVSALSHLLVSSGNQQLYQHHFKPGPGQGEWSQVIYSEEWDIYQNRYDREFSFTLEQDVESLRFLNGEGDWMTFSQIRISKPGEVEIQLTPGISDWGVPQTTFRLNGSLLEPQIIPAGAESYYEQQSLMEEWSQLAEQGVPVMVGEWGVHNRTPHNVTLAFMEDQLKEMSSSNLSWALWNFRGSFGILDSGRLDVEYESLEGLSLDRQMLELLKRY